MIVGTFGDRYWFDLARDRAIPSAAQQGPIVEIIHVHADTIERARNEGAATAETEWLIFLDADDELAPGYAEALLDAEGDLRSPAVQYVHDDHEEEPRLLAPKPLSRGNYLVIGTMMRRDMFWRVGGFYPYPFYEDWDLFWRISELGASISQVPDAVYRVFVNPLGRNLGPTEREKRRMLRRIRLDHERANAHAN